MMRQGRSPHDYFTPSERDLPVLVLLVKEGLVTAIENIKLEDVELTLEQTEVLMSVARRVVVLRPRPCSGPLRGSAVASISWTGWTLTPQLPLLGWPRYLASSVESLQG